MPRERVPRRRRARSRRRSRRATSTRCVLSQRWTARLGVDPFDVYRALRALNPSPYLFYLETREASVLGSSPEMLVRCRGRRGRDAARSRARAARARRRRRTRALAAALLGRPQGARRARHAGRSRAQRPRARLRDRERARSRATRRSRSSRTCSTSSPRSAAARGGPRRRATRWPRAFRPGTLTGAPKIRAMELIDELEARAARRLRRRGRLPRRRRQLRHGDRDPHGGRRGGRLPRPGGRRHRRRLGAREGVRARPSRKAAALFRADRARPRVVPGREVAAS